MTDTINWRLPVMSCCLADSEDEKEEESTRQWSVLWAASASRLGTSTDAGRWSVPWETAALRRRSCERRHFLINWAKDEAKHWTIDSLLEIATNQTNCGGLESWHRTSPLGWEVGTYVGWTWGCACTPGAGPCMYINIKKKLMNVCLLDGPSLGL